MKYLSKSFSTPANSDAYRQNWEANFGEPQTEPERIVLNDMDAARFEREINNPLPPNEKLVALFRDDDDDAVAVPCGRCADEGRTEMHDPRNCTLPRPWSCLCCARMAGECLCGAWDDAD